MNEINLNSSRVFCNFCNKDKAEVVKLIVANNVGICDECIELCGSILNKEKNDALKKEKRIGGVLDPAKVKKYLDYHIIGQDDAKITLSVAVVNHYKRIYFKPQNEVEKSNILIFGPTGSGKTLLARMIAKYLKVPFVIADATTLTEAGYVGDDVESLVSRLLAEAEYNVEKCEQGIIFIDEVDKIARKSENPFVRDVSGEGVQQALLKLVEGTKCKVNIGGNRRNVMSESIEVDTRNILFIAAGAFTDIDKIINNRTNSASKMGFNGSVTAIDTDRNHFQHDDFIKFGMIPEFTGRFPLITYVEDLTLSDMTAILTDTKNNLIRQMQFYFKIDNINLVFTADAINEIAKQALAMKSGARGLKSILENLLKPYMFNIEAIKSEFNQIEITQDTVLYGTLANYQKN